MGKIVHGTAANQRVQDAFVRLARVDSVAEVCERFKRPCGCSRGFHGQHRPLSYPAYGAQTVDHDVIVDGESIAAAIHARRHQFDAHTPYLIHKGHYPVGVLHISRQGCGHELCRVVGFQPGSLEGNHRVAGAVRFVECVACKLLHQTEYVFGQHRVDATSCRTINKLLANFRHFLRLLLAHGASQEIRLTEAEATKHLCNRHHLLLIEHDPVGIS